MEAQLSIEGNAVASGHCVAAFAQPEGQAGVFVVADRPLEAAALFTQAAGAVRAGLLIGGASREELDRLLAAVAVALAGPPEEISVSVPAPGTSVAVEVLEGGRVRERVESALALCGVTCQEGIRVLVNAPAEALVALARALVAVVSLELGGEGAGARRAALLREMVHAVLNPESRAMPEAAREYR